MLVTISATIADIPSSSLAAGAFWSNREVTALLTAQNIWILGHFKALF